MDLSVKFDFAESVSHTWTLTLPSYCSSTRFVLGFPLQSLEFTI